MNETAHPENLSDFPWPTSDYRIPVADTSMLPGSEKAPPAAVNLLKHAVQGAHETLDRLAGSAAPAVRQLGDGVSATVEALGAKAGQWREARDAWAQSSRTAVRSHPLMAVAAALALGIVIARVTRGTGSAH